MAANKEGIFHRTKITTPEDAANFLFKELYKILGINYSGPTGKTLGSVNVILGGNKQAALTLGSGGPISLSEIRIGILELYRILSDNATIRDLVKQTFSDIIIPVLQARWRAAGGSNFARAKSVRLTPKMMEKLIAGGTSLRGKPFDVEFRNQRPTGEFTKAGLNVEKLLTSSDSIKSTSNTGVGLAGIDELLQASELSSNSAFNSVFMMLEFGTGQFAQPKPRLYSGLGATPFKVPPAIGAPSGSWYSSRELAFWATIYLNQYSNSVNERSIRRIKAQLKEIREDYYLSKYLRRPPEVWNPGYEPRPTIFENRQIAAEIVEALDACGPHLVQLISEQVRKKSPNFPRLAFQTAPRKRTTGVGISL